MGVESDPVIESPAYTYQNIPDAERAKEIPPAFDADLHMDPEEDTSEMVTGLEAPPAWRVGKALLKLREQVNLMAPRRSKASDGAIGDPAHQSRASDHNPWVREGGMGIVTAMDITHDPANGCNCNTIAEAIRAGRDGRVKYIIWNRQIASSAPKDATPAWGWRPYTGKNPHNHHIHVSVKPESANYDSTADWNLGAAIA